MRKRGSYQDTRARGTAKRWQLIKKELDEWDESIVDIGCNAGKLTVNTAQNGLFSLGVDTPESEAIMDAIEKSKQIENVAFMRAQVSPDNINHFTNFDVVFLLSVYHHWWRQFGEESAEAMLQSFHGVNKIFFEPPSKQSKYTAYDEEEHDQAPLRLLTLMTRRLSSTITHIYKKSLERITMLFI